MALQISREFPQINDTINAYVRVVGFNINVERSVEIVVYIYVSLAARNAYPKAPLMSKTFDTPPAGKTLMVDILTGANTTTNAVTAAYNYLKTLAEFAGATDV